MKIIATGLLITIAVSASCSQPLADERLGDAAIGALSGAVVLGPVGAAAGAVVGYTMGPSIARSLGIKKSKPRRRARTAKASKASLKRAAAPRMVPMPPTRPAIAQASIPPAPEVSTAQPTEDPSPDHTGAIPPTQGLE